MSNLIVYRFALWLERVGLRIEYAALRLQGVYEKRTKADLERTIEQLERGRSHE